MSILREMDVSCPKCGHPVAAAVFESINADRRPDLRARILEGRLQVVTCPSCAAEFRIEPRLNYLDSGRRHWVAALPAADLPGWRDEEGKANAAFAAAYGPGTSPGAQAVGAGLSVRLTFGWPALREKIWLAEAGLDDATVELAKLAILGRQPGAHLGAGDELRVTGGGGETLVFGWFHPDGTPADGQLSVPRSLLAEIEADTANWAALRAELTSGPLVDAQKLFVSEEILEPV